MKTISFLLFGSVFLSSCFIKDPAPSGQNLLVDGDMEATNGGDWNAVPNAHGIYTWSTGEAQSGSHSLAIEVNTDTANSYSEWNKYVPITSDMIGKDLTFSVSVKGNNLIGDGAAIGIEAVDGNNSALLGNFTPKSFNVTGSFGWTTYLVKIKDLPVSAMNIYLSMYINKYSEGTVYFDNAKLKYN